MKTLKRGIIIGALAVVFASAVHTFAMDTEGLQLVPADQVPRSGNFWLIKDPYSTQTTPPFPSFGNRPGIQTAKWGVQPAVPYPCVPDGLDVPIYWLGDGEFLVDNSEISYTAKGKPRSMANAMMSFLGGFTTDDEEGSDDPEPGPSPDPRRNYAKFQNQIFSLVDTNNAAANDTNLYNALLLFPSDTGTNSTLQILPYGANAVIIKANHFDYSAETDRDFALLVCDKLETPTWKSIDFAGASDAQDGWLVQGIVPNWKVTDPMYFLVSNIAKDANAFFKAIPYAGPIVEITSPQPNDTVSNTMTFQVSIQDLTGVTNDTFNVTVDDYPARFSLSPTNTFTVNTKYNPNGPSTVYLEVVNKASVYDLTNAPADQKLIFGGTGSLPLDFENDTYLLFQGDYASPEQGTNSMFFVIDKEQDIEATIRDPRDGHVLAHYAGHVPFAVTIEIDWNFTETNGAPYTNDTYAVQFIAYDPTELNFTNKIDGTGVRPAGGCILTYEEEDPAVAPYLNSEADKWVSDALATGLYKALYDGDPFSLPQYQISDIGPNRDNPSWWYTMPLVLTKGSETNWLLQTVYSLTNGVFSDFDYCQGHSVATGLGGGPRGTIWVADWIDSQTIKQFVTHVIGFTNANRDWRMRKVNLWACNTTTPDWVQHLQTLPDAFGIRPKRIQNTTKCKKNVGLFFEGDLPFGFYSGTTGGTVAEMAADFDTLWVCGPNAFPGGCDPTYAFSWALRQIRNMNPEIEKGKPVREGFGFVPYTAIYDDDIAAGDTSHVKH